jgi:hypothetical protein
MVYFRRHKNLADVSRSALSVLALEIVGIDTTCHKRYYVFDRMGERERTLADTDRRRSEAASVITAIWN